MEEHPPETPSPKRIARFHTGRSTTKSIAPDHWNLPLQSVSMLSAQSHRQSMDMEIPFAHQQSARAVPARHGIFTRKIAIFQDVFSLRIITAVSWIFSFVLIVFLCTVTRPIKENCPAEMVSTSVSTTTTTTVSTPLVSEQFALPVKPRASFKVNISALPAWSRQVEAMLLSAKGMSAVLYSYRESDVGKGIARVLKIPRSSELAAEMESEALMAATLPRIGLYSPKSVVCNAQFVGEDGRRCETPALVKELLYGFDLSDIIPAMAREPEDPDFAAMLDMEGQRDERWYRKDDRREKLRSRLQQALMCVGGRLAQDVLAGCRNGLLLDLTARNFMWATRSSRSKGVADAYELWLVDAMWLPPESEDFKHVMKASRDLSDVWYRYYAVPWSTAGPGRFQHEHWPSIELPGNLAQARTLVSYCRSR